jgi:hypothetical protein
LKGGSKLQFLPVSKIFGLLSGSDELDDREELLVAVELLLLF